ncbi:MAG: DUF3144 domain-containing protein [Pseudomonadota bacterium]
MEPTNPPNRKARRAARKEGQLDTSAFLKIADKFIDVANRENQKTVATDLHMAFLYAAARYNAFVGRSVLDVENHEQYVKEMGGHYIEMLRQHLADPGLVPGAPDDPGVADDAAAQTPEGPRGGSSGGPDQQN